MLLPWLNQLTLKNFPHNLIGRCQNNLEINNLVSYLIVPS